MKRFIDKLKDFLDPDLTLTKEIKKEINLWIQKKQLEINIREINAMQLSDMSIKVDITTCCHSFNTDELESHLDKHFDRTINLYHSPKKTI